MAKLHQWYFSEGCWDGLSICGVVTGHPRIYDTMVIQTSRVNNVEQVLHKPEQFLIHTKNSSYLCSMDDCNYAKCREYWELYQEIAKPHGFKEWEKTFECFAQRYEAGYKPCVAQEGTILLRLGNHREYYFDGMDVNLGKGKRLEGRMWGKIGTFRDSVFCVTGDKNYYFRYFPYRSGNLQFYVVPRREIPVYIENSGESLLRVDYKRDIYFIEPGQTLEMKPSNAQQEEQLSSEQDLYDAFDTRRLESKQVVTVLQQQED